MRKEIDRVYTVFAAQVMGWQHGACDHFAALSMYKSAFSFLKIPWDKLAFLQNKKLDLN